MTPETPRQRAGGADATALRGVAPGRVIPAASRASDCGGAPAASRAFWEQVTSGGERLWRHEDELVWQMRAQGFDFRAIAASILQRREADAAYAARKSLRLSRAKGRSARTCLRCERAFPSAGPQHRLCRDCRRFAA